MAELGDQYNSVPDLPAELIAPKDFSNSKQQNGSLESMTTVNNNSAKATPMPSSPRDNTDIDHISPTKKTSPKKESAKKGSSPKKDLKQNRPSIENERVITEHLEDGESVDEVPTKNKTQAKIQIGSKFDNSDPREKSPPPKNIKVVKREGSKLKTDIQKAQIVKDPKSPGKKKNKA